jgi:hypothetical protein
MNKQESINKFLTEKFLGRCWHEQEDASFWVNGEEYQYYRCKFCQKDVRDWGKDKLNLFTPEGFFILWGKAQKEDWWAYCNGRLIGKWAELKVNTSFIDYVINPLTFPILLAEFLGWKEGE